MSNTRVREDELPVLRFETRPPRPPLLEMVGRVLGALVMAVLGGLILSAGIVLIVMLWRAVL